ncbi:MAG TPA: glycosyltransferase family 4 protein, partial [Candidatus Dormibacteraeota bacterium]|nr:glycosyltransferase family 4 protein [Candidatus Dormibacteraeota bacterium]HVD01948.1 glycosyltransferase family 4 protein [Candidatus Dormibacteraeota bacterium]
VNGVHGFLVETEDEMLAAVERVGTLDRRTCRESALERFSTERMVDDYERVYRVLIGISRVAAAATVPAWAGERT